MDTTVRIEYMLVSPTGQAVIQNWTNSQGSVQNDPQIYVPRAMELKRTMSVNYAARVRVVGEQSNRIVDMFP
jgi:hypothetical protein